jgi:hypothetical protein
MRIVRKAMVLVGSGAAAITVAMLAFGAVASTPATPVISHISAAASAADTTTTAPDGLGWG